MPIAPNVTCLTRFASRDDDGTEKRTLCVDGAVDEASDADDESTDFNDTAAALTSDAHHEVSVADGDSNGFTDLVAGSFFVVVNVRRCEAPLQSW